MKPLSIVTSRARARARGRFNATPARCIRPVRTDRPDWFLGVARAEKGVSGDTKCGGEITHRLACRELGGDQGIFWRARQLHSHSSDSEYRVPSRARTAVSNRLHNGTVSTQPQPFRSSPPSDSNFILQFDSDAAMILKSLPTTRTKNNLTSSSFR